MQGNMMELIVHSSALVKAVLVLLAGLSILTWSIIFAKLYAFVRARSASEAFLRAWANTPRLGAMADGATRFPCSPMARMCTAVWTSLNRGHRDDLERIVKAAATREEEALHAYLIVLATTGSTAPFIGLLGTVWGIMDAFRGIGATGSASLAVVAPAIAEALITTAAGLAVAIPAVIGYNASLHRIRRISVELQLFAEELVQHVRSGKHMPSGRGAESERAGPRSMASAEARSSS